MPRVPQYQTYDPPLTPLTPQAKPLDLSVAYPNFQQAHNTPIDLGEIATFAGVVKKGVEKNEAAQDKEAARVEKQAELDAEREAVTIFEQNKDALRDSQSKINQKIAMGVWPEMASPRAQKHLLILQGVDAADNYGNAAEAAIPDSSALVDENGKPKEVQNWQDVKNKAWEAATADLPAMNNEYGRAAAAARKNEIDKSLDRKRNLTVAENQRILRDALQGNKVGRTIQEWSQGIKDPAELRDSVTKLESLSHNLGTTQSIGVTLRGIDAQTQLMEKDAAMEALGILSDAKVGGDSALARDQWHAGLQEIERKVLSADRRDDRLRRDKQQSEEFQAKHGLNTKYYGQLLDAAASGVPSGSIEDQARADIASAPPAMRPALERELVSMKASVNRGTMQGDAGLYKNLLERVKDGTHIDAELASDTYRQTLSPQQLKDLYKENGILANIDDKLKKTTFWRTRRQLEGIVTDSFVGQGAESTHGRTVINEQIAPILKKWQSDVRNRAVTDDEIALNESFAKELNKGGISDKIETTIETYRNDRAKLLSELEPKIERGIDQKKILESERANILIGDRLKELRHQNQLNSDPSQYLGSGKEFGERWRGYTDNILKTIAPAPQDRGVEATRASKVIGDKAYTKFMARLKGIRESNVDAKEIDRLAIGALEEEVQLQIDAVFEASIKKQAEEAKKRESAGNK